MIKLLTRCMLFGILFLATSLDRASAQEGEAPSLPASFSEPMSLYSAALGSFTRPISSSNAEAQAYFDQGFQLKYAFAKLEAVRSFREAWMRDPTCAICYWGEAWAWGPFLNGGMPPNQAHHAYTAIQKALALAEDHASPSEKAFIDAMAVRYVENFDPDKREEQDTAYVEAMRRQLTEKTYDHSRPRVVPIKEDLRYRSWESTPEPEANAVVICAIAYAAQ